MQRAFHPSMLVLVGLGVGLLSGCQGRDATNPAEGTAPVAEQPATHAPAVEAVTQGASAKGMLTADKITLDSCNPAVVKVSWDITSLAPRINDVEVFAGDALFAAGGTTGSSDTGPWTQPGTRFVLKSKPDGEELDSLTIGGPASCPK